jgi:hypothetical protein
MRRSEDYRRFAEECLVLAGATEDERTRAVFLQMAQVWFRLAEENLENQIWFRFAEESKDDGEGTGA